MASKKPTNHAAGAVSLKVLAERKEVESVTKSTPTFMIDPKVIQVKPGFNARPINAEHVAVLKAAWLAAPVQQRDILFGSLKVTVADGVITVRDGHHRLEMYNQLIAEGVPILRVKCEEFKGTEPECILLMLGSGDGLTYTPLQTGVKYAELVGFGWSYAEIAKARGRSTQHVKDMIELAESGAAVTDMVTSGSVSAATALKVVRKSGSEAAAVLTAGVAAASAAGKTKVTEKTLKAITPKVIAKLGTAVVRKVAKASEVTAEHLESMLESPTFTADTKKSVQVVMDALDGKQPPRRSGDNVSAGGLHWLDGLRTHKHPLVKTAAEYLSTMLAVANGSRTVMDSKPPSVMTLEEAIQTEIDSNGELMAEVMCPEHAALVVYLRSAAK